MIVPPDDEYESGAYRWWHLSSVSPELEEALGAGWFPDAGRILDVGCGAGSELAALEAAGIRATGIDLSRAALLLARERSRAPVAVADVTEAPFAADAFDAALDRGCFHHLGGADRRRYAAELARVLAPDAPFLLRACLTSEGRPNGIDEASVRAAFQGWTVDRLCTRRIPSDTRTMSALVCWLRAPAGVGLARPAWQV